MSRIVVRCSSCSVDCGTNRAIANNPMIPRSATTPKVALQPMCCPMNVPIGTPSTVATVKPVNMIETALPCFPGGTILVATTVAIAKNNPCAMAVMIRENKTASYEVTNNAAAFPIVKTIISPSKSFFLSMRLNTAAKSGVPIASASAYPEIKEPAFVNEMSKSDATVDNRPTMTNSVVPIANALMARAMSA